MSVHYLEVNVGMLEKADPADPTNQLTKKTQLGGVIMSFKTSEEMWAFYHKLEEVWLHDRGHV